MRLLPAAAIAPFASTLGDRFRRERFLFGLALLGAAGLATSAIGAEMGSRATVFIAGSVVGVCSTLFRPALIALLPSLARTARELIAANGATSTIESLGTLIGPLAAGLLVAIADVEAVFLAAAAALIVAAAALALILGRGARGNDAERGPRRGLAGLQGHPGSTPGSAPRRPDRIADVRARVPQRVDRRHGVPGTRPGSDGGRLPDRRDRRRRPARRTRRRVASR